jgi:uncharacterized membrane protein
MTTRSTLGRLFFAIALVGSGILQLVTGHFVRLVPAPPAGVVAASALGPWLVGLILIALGLAFGTGRLGRPAALVLGALLLVVFLFVQLPMALADPSTGFLWTNPCKVLALLGGAILVAASLPERQDGGPDGLYRFFQRLQPLGPLLLAGFLILAGIQHFAYAPFVAHLIPAWIPQPLFWVYFTGVALVAGGVGILVPKTARLAATLAGVMLLLWVLMLHIPRAVTLKDAAEVAGIFEALAMSGAAFLVADRRRAAQA